MIKTEVILSDGSKTILTFCDMIAGLQLEMKNAIF